MSLSATGAHRPLQSKPKQNPFLKRSSAFASAPRTKPGTSLKRKPSLDEDALPLPSGPLVHSLAPRGSADDDVPALFARAREDMFAPIPERGAGMNSVRISEVLRFRRGLAPVVSVAHLHAIARSRTGVDREVARRIAAGEMRRVVVLGRGRGGARVGDCLVRLEDWVSLVEGGGLPEGLGEKYIAMLKGRPMDATVDAAEFEEGEVALLVRAGFMTGTSALAGTGPDSVSRAGAFGMGSGAPVAKAGEVAPTGSHDAVGGIGAIHLRGGATGGLPRPGEKKASGSLTFSLPGTGAYLKLVTEARTHLVQLLTKSSPKYKEALKDMLRERWDGNILADDASSRAKRARGEWVGVLPGKTKKWKSFYGMNFDWILEECLGSGAVECFNTGSVGLGVRAT